MPNKGCWFLINVYSETCKYIDQLLFSSLSSISMPDWDWPQALVPCGGLRLGRCRGRLTGFRGGLGGFGGKTPGMCLVLPPSVFWLRLTHLRSSSTGASSSSSSPSLSPSLSSSSSIVKPTNCGLTAAVMSSLQQSCRTATDLLICNSHNCLNMFE